MTYVPVPARESAGQIRVAAGDTIVSLCSKLGQPLANYPALIAANLDRPMTDAGVPEGQAVVFAGLHEGDMLNVPAGWGSAPVTRWPFNGRLAGLEGAPGMLGDAVTADFVKAFPFDPASGLTLPQYSANVHVLTSWWRDEHQDGSLPKSAADWAPYATAAAAWWKNVGSKLTPELTSAIDFGAPPWFQLFQLAQQNLPLVKNLLAADRAKVNAALQHYVSPGQFPKPGWKPVVWRNFTDSMFQGLDQMGWLPQDWAKTAGLRWDLLPFDQINWAGYPGGNVTDWLVSEIKRLAAPQEDIQIEIPGGSLPGPGWSLPNIPGVPPIGGGIPGVPGACPPQGVPKNGTCDCTEKMGPTAIFDEQLNLCVDCGPNTKPYVKGTKQCECLEGYEPHPSGAEGSGCVKKAGPGGGDLPPPSAGEKESPWKPAAIALGVLAVGWGLAKAAKVI